MKGNSCGEQVRQRASLNFDCVDQRSAVGSRPRTTRGDYTASQIFFFFRVLENTEELKIQQKNLAFKICRAEQMYTTKRMSGAQNDMKIT